MGGRNSDWPWMATRLSLVPILTDEAAVGRGYSYMNAVIS
jgi:hypothetical protein